MVTNPLEARKRREIFGEDAARLGTPPLLGRGGGVILRDLSATEKPASPGGNDFVCRGGLSDLDISTVEAAMDY